ncbi:MAG: lipase family protein [Clostridiales bacterium]|jgi:hypothetical protein|nr:lipase family protein [Clostridiales bacterium]
MKQLTYTALAYADEQPYERGTETLFTDDARTGVQYWARKGGGTLRITFRGSDNPRDYLTHLRFWKMAVPYNNDSSRIRVHNGFINAYKVNRVRAKIQSMIDSTVDKIIVSGHSYGAALAVLCAVDLQYNFKGKDVAVFLFGCPRVGNAAFAASYNRRVFKTFRVENSNDVVTKLPFAFMGYRHVGVTLRIGAPKVAFWFSFRDHLPREYYRQLWKRLRL